MKVLYTCMMFMLFLVCTILPRYCTAGPSHVWHYHGNQYRSSLTHYVYRVVSPPCTCMMFVRDSSPSWYYVGHATWKNSAPLFSQYSLYCVPFPHSILSGMSDAGYETHIYHTPIIWVDLCVVHVWNIYLKISLQNCLLNLEETLFLQSFQGEYLQYSLLLSVYFRLDLFSYTYTLFL